MTYSLLARLAVVCAFIGICTSSGSPDNEGTEFVFTFGTNDDIGYTGGSALEVFITTRKDTNVAFNYTKDGSVEVASVTAGEIFSYIVSDANRMSDTYGGIIESKSQIIMAQDEIIVYASNKMKYSADAFLALPTDVQSTEYYIPSISTTCDVGGPLILIAAISDGTMFNITKGGITIVSNTNLNRGQSFQFQADYEGKSNGRKRSIREKRSTGIDDLTGAQVLSNKPIAVQSGHRRTYIGVASGSSDHVIEMIPPINTLGREFLLASLYEREGDLVIIVAAEDAVNLKITRSSQASDSVIVLANAGDYTEFSTDENEVLHIQSTGPTIVTQFAKTGAADGSQSDPMMALVPPVEQYGNSYIFTTPSGVSAPYRNYVNIVMKSDETDGFRLDDNPVTISLSDGGFSTGDTFNVDCWAQNSWQTIGTSGYSARALAILHGTRSIYHINPTVSFYAMMYGQVKYESYGFPAGSRLASIGSYCSVSIMTANDGLDNDCDGAIDEELLNGIDDDGDGQTDEDCSTNALFTAAPTIQTTTTAPTTTTTSRTTTTTPTTTTTNTPTTTTTASTTTTSTTTNTPTTTSTTPTTTTTTPKTTTTTPTSTTTTPTTTTTTTPTTTTTTPTTTTTTHTTATTTTPTTTTTTTPTTTTTTTPTTTATMTPATITMTPATTTMTPATTTMTTATPTTTTVTTTSTTVSTSPLSNVAANGGGNALAGSTTSTTPAPDTTAVPTTAAPTTAVPTTAAPTSATPTTAAPTTAAPMAAAPMTAAPTTIAPTTAAPTTAAPTNAAPTTAAPTTAAPTTAEPTTAAPTNAAPTTAVPSTAATTTAAPTTLTPITAAAMTAMPSSAAPRTATPTIAASNVNPQNSANSNSQNSANSNSQNSANSNSQNSANSNSQNSANSNSGSASGRTSQVNAQTSAESSNTRQGGVESTQIDLGTTTIDQELLAGLAEQQKLANEEVILGATIPIALAVAVAITAGCVMIYLAIRRKKRKQEEDEEEDPLKKNSSRPSTASSDSSRSSAMGVSPTPSTDTTCTYMNDSMSSNLMKQTQRSGLRIYPGDRNLSPVDTPYSPFNVDRLRGKTVSPTQIAPTIQW